MSDAFQSHSLSPIPIRALFLSDFHFGYKGVDGAALLQCLQSYAPDKIYLIGDIIDGWKLSKRWHWRADYTRVLDALVDHKKRGAKIVYLPGNHDERVRKASPLRRARFALKTGIRICDRCIHRMKDGRRLIGGPMSKLGDWVYVFFTEILGLSKPAPLMMIDGRLQRFSLAKALMKRSAKTALRLMSNLERAVKQMVRHKHAHGLICGHTCAGSANDW